MEDLWALGHADDSFGGSVLGSKGTQWLWFTDRDEVLDYLLSDYVDLLADTGDLDEERNNPFYQYGIAFAFINNLSVCHAGIQPYAALAALDDVLRNFELFVERFE